MLYLILIGVLGVVAVYSILAAALRVAPFRAASYLSRMTAHTKKSETLSSLLAAATNWLAPFLSLNMIKKTKLLQRIQAGDLRLTPQQYEARKLIIASLIALPTLLLLFVHPLCIAVTVLFFLLAMVGYEAEMKDKGVKRTENIENELPQFVFNVTVTCRTSHNVLDILESYKQDYESDLTRELAITVADMRTGNQEQALLRLAARLNLPLLTELVRDLVAALRGEDMTLALENLARKAKEKRRAARRARVQAKNPKIQTKYLIMALWQMLSLVVLMLMSLQSAGGFGLL